MKTLKRIMLCWVISFSMTGWVSAQDKLRRRMLPVCLVLAGLFLGLLMSNPARAQVLFASTGLADGGRLLTIDPTTGVGTLVGNVAEGATNFSRVTGLAINSAGEMLGTGLGDLFRVDPSTGEATSIGLLGFRTAEGIAFDENDVLYGITQFPEQLITIDTNTGLGTLVGPNRSCY